MIASLPMYDLPELQAATDRLWQAVACALVDEGIAAPHRLARNVPAYTVWTSPDLLLAQTCGYPFTHRLAGRVRLVAVPCYTAPACDGANYCGIILARRGTATALIDVKHARAACNSRDSQSGYAAFRAAVAPHSNGTAFFSKIIETGSHAASIAMVREGHADVCCVDAVVYALLGRHRPAALAGLVEIGRTPSSPGLPLVTSASRGDEDIAAMRRALASVMADPTLADVRSDLLLAGFAHLSADDYHVILEMEEECRRSNYPELA